VTFRELWDEEAENWALWARTPGCDPAHELVNFPPFLKLLPPPGRATLDVGCGEGRVGAELERRGHHVVGVDSSPQLVKLALERHEAIVADAAELPFEDDAFDLVVAYMSLMNLDNLDGAVCEAARVLEPNGRLCVSVLHPLFAAGEWLDPGDVESPLLIRRYFDGPTKVWTSERNGVRMTYHDRVIPLSVYTGALEDAGLLLEALREIPSGRRPRIPLFLHLRLVKP
jgi:SAM-dependent methyltransferase